MEHSVRRCLGWRIAFRLCLGLMLVLGTGCSHLESSPEIPPRIPDISGGGLGPETGTESLPQAAPQHPERPVEDFPDPSSAASTQAEPEVPQMVVPFLEGIASWYGPRFHGKPTASGEIYNQYALTAAHPLLPLGTLIEVENQNNGRKIWVRINDRGPYAKGRILDLSRMAAQHLGIIPAGTAPVRINILKWPDTVQLEKGLKAYSQYVVQVAAYEDRQQAESYRAQLEQRFTGVPFRLDRASKGFTAVVAGPYDLNVQARRVAVRLRTAGITNIVRRFRN